MRGVKTTPLQKSHAFLFVLKICDWLVGKFLLILQQSQRKPVEFNFFERLRKELAVEALLADIPTLTAILTYHVVGAKVMAADVKPGKVKTVNGKEFEVKVADGKVTVDGATVVKTDIVGTNGVIHVIDAVILPKAE